MTIIRLNKQGLERVLNSQEGMTFVVDSFTNGVKGKVAHVRDYRSDQNGKGYQIWSIGADGYEIVSENSKQTETQLLTMYNLLQDQCEHFYEQGSPAIETTSTEAKLEQMKAVLTVLNIAFKE